MGDIQHGGNDTFPDSIACRQSAKIINSSTYPPNQLEIPMQTIESLNSHFGLAKQLHFKESNGMVIAEIDNQHATASICLQGAHIMTWTPKGQKPVIWLSSHAKVAPGKSIRGGVPVCWPWFGPHAREVGFPGHGFARTVMWEVIGAKSPQRWRHLDGVSLTSERRHARAMAASERTGAASRGG